MTPLVCFGHPELSPVNKALSLPLFNPIDRHGRVFFLAWFSFLCSFLSWYSMSALITVSIRTDLGLTEAEVANSNILAGISSLLVRLTAGFACERWGPRKVLATILICSAIPGGLAGTATGVEGLYFIRFFMGIAGGAFVPAQVWITAWFDKRVIGTASATGAGWGDSGVGWTFICMHAIHNGLLKIHTPKLAWRISFIFPALVLILIAGVVMLGEDTPNGPWSTRNLAVTSSHNSSRTFINPFDSSTPPKDVEADAGKKENTSVVHEEMVSSRRGSATTIDSKVSMQEDRPAPPLSLRAGLADVACLPTLMLASAYAAAFGSSLAINSILVPMYMETFGWSQSRAGYFAAIVGCLNVVSRPTGGILSDVIARRAGTGRVLQTKKYWMCALIILQGSFGLLVGLLNPSSAPALLSLMAIYAFSTHAANGAIYAVLPGINSHVNGLMGGAVGSAGNLGGVILATVSRFSPFNRTIYIAGAISIVVGFLSLFVNPTPKRQRRFVEEEGA